MYRFEEIDVLKGLGIILMIMGHQYYGVDFDKWIHSFHMPMFFIISGFLYLKPSSVKKAFCNKAKSLLVPYAFLACIHLGIMSVKTFIVGNPVKTLFSYLYHILIMNTEGMPICGAIWFLTAIFFTIAIFIVIDRFVSPSILKIFCILFIVFWGFVIPKIGYRLPLALDVSFVGIGLFFIGNVLRGIYEKTQTIKNCYIWGIVGLLIGTIAAHMNTLVNLRLGLYGNIIIFWIAAVVMTVSLYLICYGLKKKNNFIIKEISFIGKNSIIYLGFNQLVLLFFNRIISNNCYANLFIKLISLVSCLGILHLITIVIYNSKIKKLIGK